MTTIEIQAAWDLSYQKHLARLQSHEAIANKAAKMEAVVELAKEAADEDIRLLTRPPREF